MENIKILLIEDDKNLGTVLQAYLNTKGYETTWVEDGQIAYEEFLKQSFDFCIIDVIIPSKDGFTLAKDMRKEKKNVPILFLTVCSSDADIIKGFTVGADDYLTKPFRMDELLMRIQAILRRTELLLKPYKTSKRYQIGEFSFDTNRQTLTKGNYKSKLTSKETALLSLLCERKNNVLTRSEALHKVWGDDSYFNARSMDVYITKLRKYLKPDPMVALINIHGVGFKLVTGDDEA